MSDAAVRAALAQMEVWLADETWQPEAEVLAAWDRQFLAALAEAERGPGWAEQIALCHHLGERLQARTVAMEAQLELLRNQLEGHSLGTRALKGYGAALR